MDLRCPKCNSTDLKKISLAYEEGLSSVDARTRLRAVAVGGNGPDLVVGRATTRGSQQSALSKKLSPPLKWSYRKPVFWSAVAFLCGGWLVFYINTITKNASTVSSPALAAYAVVAAATVAFILGLVVRHNVSVYPRRFGKWDRSFICQCCGKVSVDHDPIKATE
jgi:hypothetical protein